MIEGDNFHSNKSKRLMGSGVPLTDELRAGWLESLGGELAARPAGAIVTCSALKRAYRDVLRRHVPDVRFVFMQISYEEALRRVTVRGGNFPPSLVRSQFTTLESPIGEPDVLPVDATRPLSDLVAQVASWVSKDFA